MTVGHRAVKIEPHAWMYRGIRIDRLESPAAGFYPFTFTWPGPPEAFNDVPRLRDAKAMIDSFYRWEEEGGKEEVTQTT